MIDLHIQVMQAVVMEEIGFDTGALRHPVEPDTSYIMIDMVVSDLHVNGPMQLDACHLRPGIALTDMNVVDAVVGYRAKDGPQAADNAGLAAIEDMIVANDMMTDGLSIPAVVEGTFDRAYIPFRRFRFVIPLISIFAKRDAGIF